MLTKRDEPISLLGESPAIVSLRREIQEAARTNAKVLILGETGVGKEVASQLIHRYSGRQGRAFVALNCSGIPETLLESELFGHTRGSFTGAYRDKPGLVRQAEGGTLFLDELGEMSLRMQAVLLRFTETGEVQPVGADRPAGRSDVRLITATNRDLRAQIADGKFREDLYYRLNVIQLRIPPVRERATDIPLLLHHFLEQASVAHRLPCPRLSADAEAALQAYPWPGNVRELKNITERLVVRDVRRPITRDDLPMELRAKPKETGTAVFASSAAALTTSDTVPAGPSAIAESLWRRLQDGDNFWSVAEMFKAHDITRADLRMLIHLGLHHTRGNYRALISVFNLPANDYKRFQAFLFQHKCNLPFRSYRTGEAAAVPARPAQPFEVAS
jgi:DNA-binding NtrC family response regulator